MNITGQELLAAFNQLKVLIIGDVMVDAYDWGSVERISPEAPVPVVHLKKSENRLGGAANVALNIQALGATPILCAAIGNDSGGDIFLRLLQQQGLSQEGIVKLDIRPTTIKRRILAGSQHLLRIDSETDQLLSHAEQEMVWEKLEKLIPKVDIVLFEDYDKGLVSEWLIAKVAEACAKHQKRITVDPKKRNFLHYKNVSLFKPNLKELKEGLKIDFLSKDLTQLQIAVELLHTHLNAENYLITLSEAGVYYKTSIESGIIAAHKREIADVSGAGDTVISTATLCMALGLPMATVASLANLSGGLVCEHVGVVPIDKNHFINEAQNLNLLS